MPDPTPADLLASIRASYAGLATYVDCGTCTCEFDPDDPARSHISSLGFRTRFVRGRGFYFEFWTSRDPVLDEEPGLTRYVIWTEDGRLRSWWSFTGELTEHGSIEEAVAAPTGISHFVAFRVPMLLAASEAVGTALPRASDVVSLRAVDQFGEAAWELTAERDGDRVTLWVRRDPARLWRVHQRIVHTREKHERTLARMDSEGLPPDFPRPEFERELTMSTITQYFVRAPSDEAPELGFTLPDVLRDPGPPLD